jgi:hypothetical protein
MIYGFFKELLSNANLQFIDDIYALKKPPETGGFVCKVIVFFIVPVPLRLSAQISFRRI